MTFELSDHPAPSERQLITAVVQGDARAWSEFLANHGALILGAVMQTCEQDCRVPRRNYACILHILASLAPEPADSPSRCPEALSLFRWAVLRIRERLPEYTGAETINAWLLKTLAELRSEYLVSRLGRLSISLPLSEASAHAQNIFRLSSRVGTREEALRRSGLTPEVFAAAEEEIKTQLQSAGLAWWPWLSPDEFRQEPLPGKFNAEPAPALPHWLLRSVLDTTEQEAPEPQTGRRTLRERLLAQPDWLAGVVVGGVVCVFVFLIVLPRQEYARPVKAPDDQVLALAALPLTPDLSKRLTQAREDLRKGKIESALQHLNRVVVARPDQQEARWLLASTYDRLGDQSKAFRHYKAFLHVHDTRNALRDERAQRARERLSLWDDD